MSVLSVSDQVNNDVLVPGCPPFRGNIGHQHHRLRVVCVHVEDGGVDHASHVGTVRRRAGVAGVGRETNLVVGNDMYGSLNNI